MVGRQWQFLVDMPDPIQQGPWTIQDQYVCVFSR